MTQSTHVPGEMFNLDRAEGIIDADVVHVLLDLIAPSVILDEVLVEPLLPHHGISTNIQGELRLDQGCLLSYQDVADELLDKPEAKLLFAAILARYKGDQRPELCSW